MDDGDPAGSDPQPAEATAVPAMLWAPDPSRSTRIGAFADYAAAATGRELASYDQLWEWSVSDLPAFWTAVADFFGVRWAHRPTRALGVAAMPGADWFPHGTLNYAEHALAVTAARPESATAVVALSEDGTEDVLTLHQLRQQVAAAQAGLRRLGVKRGDRVVALVPNSVHALVGLLATASLGAVWSSCSPEFGAAAVIDRFAQVKPKVLLAVDGYQFGGRAFGTAETVQRLRDALPELVAAVHLPVLDSTPPRGMLGWNDLIANPGELTFTSVPFGAPLWVLYSSGTTGLPKPIVQSVGGILLEHVKSVGLHCDLGPGDRFFWFSTTGWMMWNYLVGGLLVGATVVLYDGSPSYPDLGALWRLAERHQVGYFGTSAPFITACRRASLTPAVSAALTTIGSTGAPLDSDGFGWLAEHFPGRQIVSLSGGTDLCTAVVGGSPSVPVWSGEISCRALGAAVQSYSPDGKSRIGEVGELVITAPMPSMPVALWGDVDGSRLREAYFTDFPGVWRHGDWIRITDRGSCVIEGRSDATLNRGGVRMGTAEFYRLMDTVPGVVDSLVVDTSSDAGGDLLLFVVLAPDAELGDVAQRSRALLRAELSPRHVPGAVIAVPSIPRTLNGKKLEVPIKRVLTGVPVEQAVSRDSVADPAGLDAFLVAARAAR